MLRATGAPELILDILESALATRPQPWNSVRGHTFLYAEVAEFARTWIQLSTTSPLASSAARRDLGFATHLAPLTTVQVHRLSALLNSIIQHSSAAASARSALDLLKLYY